jgi:uncharacterized membrane protein (Fun14 family)
MEETGFTDSVKKAFTNFDRPASWYVEVGGYFIVGFIFGFLVKYGGKLFFLLLLGALLALWALDYMQLVTVHYTALKSTLGLSPETTMTDFVGQLSYWLKNHIVESLAAFFGFILAWKFA